MNRVQQRGSETRKEEAHGKAKNEKGRRRLYGGDKKKKKKKRIDLENRGE